MPLERFDRDTAIAFVDISGFGAIMKRDRDNAMEKLRIFYENGYMTLRAHKHTPPVPNVEGLFVTDCGILFVRHRDGQPVSLLERLLEVIEDLNRRMLAAGIALQTSVTYGHFAYHPKADFDGIEKNYIFGDGYIDAFRDNESAAPKLDPGLCRLPIASLPRGTVEAAEHSQSPIWRRCRRQGKHLYFYWMVRETEQIDQIRECYKVANRSKYDIINETLRTIGT